jgi:REP element-mobilizing transposase RayT
MTHRSPTQTAARRRKRATQLALPVVERRKRRKGGGRKPNGTRAGVSHLAREVFSPAEPVHVTMRTVAGLRALRGAVLFPKLRDALRSGSKDGFRVVQFTVMTNHIHLIVEAEGKESLARGMQGLAIRLARTINRHMNRKGKVWGDRYHATVLRSPTQCRHALAYVLNNARKHAAEAGRRCGNGWTDPCSSAAWFSDWAEEPREYGAKPRGGFPIARTWLLRVGWKKAAAGLIHPDEVPARGGVARRAV